MTNGLVNEHVAVGREHAAVLLAVLLSLRHSFNGS
jgi:hypothetical protein